MVTARAFASMLFSTSSAIALSGLLWESAMMVIAFQSSPILSLPRAWRDFSSVLLRFTADPATTADTAGFLPAVGVG
jgi:hypothetical protein